MYKTIFISLAITLSIMGNPKSNGMDDYAKCQGSAQKFEKLKSKVYSYLMNTQENFTNEQVINALSKILPKITKSCDEGCNQNITEDCLELANLFNVVGYDEKALSLREKSCNLKDPQGCLILGTAYQRMRNYQVAIKYYRKGCDIGDQAACGNIGMLYEKGLGVRQNDKLALDYLGTSCDAGYQNSCAAYSRIKRRYR